jgi:2-methylisocitrate lyase-like PEP mutase family enzyme
MKSVREKAELCHALHRGAEPVLSAACWDVGTARLLERVGVPLLDTTSFGAMAARGLPDAVGLATREFMLDNARVIAAAVDVPVQADLENGFGDSPASVAETIRQAGSTGIVGGSIEDATGRPDDSIYPVEFAKDRIRAAAEAARSLPIRFTLTARADQFMWGRADLAEVIRRAQAFQEAGADAVMVPGLSDPAALGTLCRAIDVPVVVLIGAGHGQPQRRTLAASGVKRIGIGGAMVRVALTALVDAARDLLDGRELDSLARAIPGRKLTEMFSRASNTNEASHG